MASPEDHDSNPPVRTEHPPAHSRQDASSLSRAAIQAAGQAGRHGPRSNPFGRAIRKDRREAVFLYGESGGPRFEPPGSNRASTGAFAPGCELAESRSDSGRRPSGPCRPAQQSLRARHTKEPPQGGFFVFSRVRDMWVVRSSERRKPADCPAGLVMLLSNAADPPRRGATMPITSSALLLASLTTLAKRPSTREASGCIVRTRHHPHL